VSCWPLPGDRARPSPRLPPSPNGEHPIGAREKEGALVTERERRALLRRRPGVQNWHELLTQAQDSYDTLATSPAGGQ
jgi:hypothetical protein